MTSRTVAQVQHRLRALLADVTDLSERATALERAMTAARTQAPTALANPEGQRVNVHLRERWPASLTMAELATELGLDEAACAAALLELVDAGLVIKRTETPPAFVADL